MARYGKSVKLMLADTFPEMQFNEEGIHPVPFSMPNPKFINV